MVVSHIFKTNGRIFTGYWLKMYSVLYIILMLRFHETSSKQINPSEIVRKYEHPVFQIARHTIDANVSFFTNQGNQGKLKSNFFKDYLENDIDNLVTRSFPLKQDSRNKNNSTSNDKLIVNYDNTLNKAFRKHSRNNFSTKYISAVFNRTTFIKNDKASRKFIKKQHMLKDKATVPAITTESKKTTGDQKATSMFRNDLFKTDMIPQKNINNKAQTISKFTGNEDDNLDDSDYVSKAKAILNQYKDIDISDEEPDKEDALKNNGNIQNTSSIKSALKGEKTSTKSSSDEVFEKSPIKSDENKSPIVENVEAVETSSKTKTTDANDNMIVEPVGNNKNILENKNETRGNESLLSQDHISEKDIQDKNEKPDLSENSGEENISKKVEKTKKNTSTLRENRAGTQKDTRGENELEASEKIKLQKQNNPINKLIDQVNGSVSTENSSQAEINFQNFSQTNKSPNQAKFDSLQETKLPEADLQKENNIQNETSLQTETNLQKEATMPITDISNVEKKQDHKTNKNNKEDTTTNSLSLTTGDKSLTTEDKSLTTGDKSLNTGDNINSVEKLEEKQENSKIVTQFDKLKSNTDKEKALSNGDNEKTLGNRDNEKALSNGENEKTLSNGGNEKTLSNDDNEKTLSNGDNENTLSNGGNEKTLGNRDNEKALSNGENEKTLSNGGNEKTLSNGDNEKTLSNGDNENTLSNGGNEKTLSNDGNKKILSNGGNEKILSNGGNENLLSNSENEKLKSNGDNEKIISHAGNQPKKKQFKYLNDQQMKSNKHGTNTLEFQKVDSSDANQSADIATSIAPNVVSASNTTPNAEDAANVMSSQEDVSKTVPNNTTVKRGAALTFSKVFVKEKKPLLSEESIQKIIKEEEESEKYDRFAVQRETLKVNTSNLNFKKIDFNRAKIKPGVPLFNENKDSTEEAYASLAGPISDSSNLRETSKTNMEIKNNLNFQKVDHISAKQSLFPASNAKTDAPEDSAERAYASLDGTTSESNLKENNSKNIKEEEIYASIDNTLTRNKTSEELERAKNNFLEEETEEWRKHIYKEVDDPKFKHKNKKKIIAWVPAKIIKDNTMSKKERLFRKRNMLKLTPIEKKMAEILVLESRNARKLLGKKLRYNDTMRIHNKHNHSNQPYENKNNFNVLPDKNSKRLNETKYLMATVTNKKWTPDVPFSNEKPNINYMKIGKHPAVGNSRRVVQIKNPMSSAIKNSNQSTAIENRGKVLINNRTTKASRTKTLFGNISNLARIGGVQSNFNQSKVLEDVYENQKCSLDDYLCHSIDNSLKREEILKQRKVIDEGELRNVERLNDQTTERLNEQTTEGIIDSSKAKTNDTADINAVNPQLYNESKKIGKQLDFNEVNNASVIKNITTNIIKGNQIVIGENSPSKENTSYNLKFEASIAALKHKTYPNNERNSQTVNNLTAASEKKTNAHESLDNITVKKIDHVNFAEKIQPIKLFKENKDNDIAISNKKPKVENIVHVYIEKRPIKQTSKHLSNASGKKDMLLNKTPTKSKKKGKHSLASKLTEDEIEKLIVAANALKNIDINSLVNGVKQKHRKKVFESKSYKKLRHKQLLQKSKDLTPENLAITGEKGAANKDLEIKSGDVSHDVEAHLLNGTVTSEQPFFIANGSMFINQGEKKISEKKVPILNIKNVKPLYTGTNESDNSLNREIQPPNENKEQPVDVDKNRAELVNKMVDEQLLLAEKFKAVAEEQIVGKTNGSKLINREQEHMEHQDKGEEKSADLQNEAIAEQNIRVAELQIEKLQQNDKHIDTPIIETSNLNTINDKEKKMPNDVVASLQTKTTELLKNPSVLSKIDHNEEINHLIVDNSKLNVPIQKILQNIDKKAPILTIKEDTKPPPKSIIDPEGITNVYSILQNNITSVLLETENPSNKQSFGAENPPKQPSETESLSKLIRLMNLEEFSFNQNKENSTSLNITFGNEKGFLANKTFLAQNVSSTKNLSHDSNLNPSSQFTNVEQNNIFSNSMLEKELLALVPSTNAIYYPRKNTTEVFVSSVEDSPDSGASISGVKPMGRGATVGGTTITIGGASTTAGATTFGALAPVSNIETFPKVNQATSMTNESFTQWVKFPNSTVDPGQLFQTKNESSNLIPSILESALKSSFSESIKVDNENSNSEKTESIDLVNPPSNIALPDYVAKSKSKETKPFHRGAMLLTPAVENKPDVERITNLMLGQKPNELAKKQQKSEEQSSVKELEKDVSGAMEELETLMKKKTEEVNKIVRQNEHSPLKAGHSHQAPQGVDIVEGVDAIRSDRPTDSSLILAKGKTKKKDFSTLLIKRNKTVDYYQEDDFGKVRNENRIKIKKFIQNLKSKLNGDELKKLVKVSDLLTRKLKGLREEVNQGQFTKKNITQKWSLDSLDDTKLNITQKLALDSLDDKKLSNINSIDADKNNLKNNDSVSHNEKQKKELLTASNENVVQKIVEMQNNYSTNDIANDINRKFNESTIERIDSSKIKHDKTEMNIVSLNSDNRYFISGSSYSNKSLIANEEIDNDLAIRKYLKENIRQHNVPTLLAEEPASEIINEIKTDILKQKHINEEMEKQNKLYYANNLTDSNESETRKIKNETIDEAEEVSNAHDHDTPTLSSSTTVSRFKKLYKPYEKDIKPDQSKSDQESSAVQRYSSEKLNNSSESPSLRYLSKKLNNSIDSSVLGYLDERLNNSSDSLALKYLNDKLNNSSGSSVLEYLNEKLNNSSDSLALRYLSDKLNNSSDSPVLGYLNETDLNNANNASRNFFLNKLIMGINLPELQNDLDQISAINKTFSKDVYQNSTPASDEVLKQNDGFPQNNNGTTIENSSNGELFNSMFNPKTTIDPYSTFKRGYVGNKKSLMSRPNLSKIDIKAKKDSFNKKYIYPLGKFQSQLNFGTMNKKIPQRNWIPNRNPVLIPHKNVNQYSLKINPILKNILKKPFQQNISKEQLQNQYFLKLREQQALQKQKAIAAKLHAQQNAYKWKQYQTALLRQQLQQQARKPNMYQQYNRLILPQYYGRFGNERINAFPNTRISRVSRVPIRPRVPIKPSFLYGV